MGSASLLVRGKRHDRNVASTLDGSGQLALMLRADTGNSARHNLATLGDEVAKRLRILVVDHQCLVGAVRTTAAPRPAHPHAVEITVTTVGASIHPTVHPILVLSHCAFSRPAGSVRRSSAPISRKASISLCSSS